MVRRTAQWFASSEGRRRLGTVLIVTGSAGFVLVAILFRMGLVRFGPEYGYPDSVADEYRIVEARAERRDQPALGSRAEIRDYLESRGVPCGPYRSFRVEPSPEGGDFSGEVHQWAECGGGRLVIHHYSHHGSKVSHIADRASCSAEDQSGDVRDGIAPFKPSYWIEGPTWAVVLERPLSADDARTRAEARSIARRTGARLYRSCAPSSQHPAAAVVATPAGATVEMVEMVGSGRFTVTVSNVTREPLVGTDTDRVTVMIEVSGVDEPYFDVAIHPTGSESYWMCGDWEVGTPVRCHIPRRVVDPLLRVSTAEWTGRIGPDHLRDIVLH